jgi:ABC-type multidrug transport system fused ATPase/permease subunit
VANIEVFIWELCSIDGKASSTVVVSGVSTLRHEILDHSMERTAFIGVLVFLADLMFAYMYVKASKNLHNSMLNSILHCNMKFFESTPVGRILNRFSKDIDLTETRIPDTFRASSRFGFNVISVIIVVSINSPLFLLFLIPLLVFFYFIQVIDYQLIYIDLFIILIQF